jgi:AAA+ superfamily predicted ATPase
VFLRVLEYYRGVLFMTTNRGTTIDDAIVSRLTARFQYENPSPGEQAELWRILSEQNGIVITKDEIVKVLSRHDHLSGRDIKNLLKMAYVISLRDGKKEITAEMVCFVAKFQARTK